MEENKLVLPAIAVRGVIPLPNNEFRIEVGRMNSVTALDAAERMYGGNILLLIQKDATASDVTEDGVEKIGVLAKITLKLKLPNKNYKVKFKISDRIFIREFTSTDPYFVCSYEKLHSFMHNDDTEMAMIKNITALITRPAANVVQSMDEISRVLQQNGNASLFSDVVAYNLRITGPQTVKYRYLEELDASKRLEYILEDLEHEKQIVEIENKINNDVKKSIDESQKEYYLREKMKAIQN
ncbi:MAG: LON peptidase substrate-binding domain-containing protein, partial [Anaeroplasmataceae bacterium]|nr:LON peptidase substrate-binding domain-containing protein [Anaeroplasmataceae bacterium]